MKKSGGTAKFFGYLFIVFLILSFLGKSGGEGKKTAATNLVESRPDISLDENAICRAAISTIMGREYNSIKAESRNGYSELWYVRPVDGEKWGYRCKVEGSNIIWAGFVDGQWGRWRNHESDAKISYRINEPNLIIYEKYPFSKAPTTKSFVLDEL